MRDLILRKRVTKPSLLIRLILPSLVAIVAVPSLIVAGPRPAVGWKSRHGKNRNTGQTQGPNAESPELRFIVQSIIARETQLVKNVRKFNPRIETYIQNFRPDPELGEVPTGDHYFLGRLDFVRGVAVRSFLPQPSLPRRILDDVTDPISGLYSVRYDQRPFAYAILIDAKRFDRQHYNFQFVRREFLGDVRCLVFDVVPRPHAGTGLFLGRIWVEDQEENIVRFNGTYAPAPRLSSYYHFDSWRQNLQPGLWLPVYVYGQEMDLKYGVRGTLRFKSQTRLWGYSLADSHRMQELTRVLVDPAAPVHETGDTDADPSPLSRERDWETQAESNVLERMEKAGLVAPAGDDVEKVLETVVNNLVLTNHLESFPAMHCRVLLTAPFETLTIGHSIIISRGLVDVLPDEASLAMMLSHELAHIVLGHNLTPKSTEFAFRDRLMVPDEVLMQRLNFRPTQQEEAAADAKAITFLQNSPYKDKLQQAGLFLRAMAATAPHTPQLFGAHLGSRLAQGNQVRRMADLMASAPELQPTRIEQIAALPLGARIKMNPWSDHVQLVKSKPETLVSAREKMPFEVTPLFPYLTRFNGPTQNVTEQNLSR